MEAFYPNQDGMRLRKSLKDRGMLLKSSTSSYYSDNSGPLPATDSYNFGTLIYEIFNGAFSDPEQLNNKGKIPQVHPELRQLTSGCIHCIQTFVESYTKTTSHSLTMPRPWLSRRGILLHRSNSMFRIPGEHVHKR